MAGKQKIYTESIRLAINYSWDNDWSNALKAYRAALDEFSDDVDALLGLGTAYSELEQYESAIRVLQRALKLNPSNDDALDKMGVTLERMNRFDEAAKTYVYAGNINAKAGQLDGAINFWEKAIKANPDQIQARNNLAQAHAKQGQTNLAISDLIAIAAILQSQGNESKAKQYLRGASQLDPDNKFVQAAIDALNNQVSIRVVQQEMAKQPLQTTGQDMLNLEAQQSQTADDEYTFLLEDFDEEEGPRNPREQVQQLALRELANVLFEEEGNGVTLDQVEIGMLINQAIDAQTRGKIPEAIETYQKISAAGFDRPAVDFILAILYTQQNQFEKATHYFNRAERENSYLLGINFALGEAYKKQNDANNALKHFVEVLKMIDIKNADPTTAMESSRMYDELMQNYIASGDANKTLAFASSLSQFMSNKNCEEKIIQARRILGGGNGNSASTLVEFLEAANSDIVLSAMIDTNEYIKQNMLMTAIETCFVAIQKSPGYLPLHLRLAEIYMKQEAIENSIQKYLAVAEVYFIRNNVKQVTSVYERVLKVAPMDVTVRSKLVELYINQNDFEAALEQYQILADAYYQLAQIEKSLEQYNKALRLTPKASTPKIWQVQILHRIGDIYTQRVNWAKAVEVYEQLIKIAPEDDKGLLMLVDLYFKVGGTNKALAALDYVIALYNKQNEQDKALQFLQDLTEIRPDEPAIREKLATFYTQLGMKDEAISQLDILGEMQLDAGLRDDATRTIQQIINLGPDNPAGYQQLLSQLKGGF